MTAKKSMAPKRKGKKQFALVTFEFSDFEGEFTLPKLDTLPLGVAAGLREGDLSKLLKFIETNAPDCLDAVEDLSGDEAGEFMEAWSKASGIDGGTGK